MSKIPTNKLAIYLIKNDYSDHKDIIKNIDELNTINISKVGTFYYSNSFTFPPSWIKNFFGTTLSKEDNIFSASAKGFLLIDIVRNAEKRTFALAFGYGWQFLNPGIYEERFGLRTVLNIIDPDNLRKIEKKNMVTVPKDASEQLSKSGAAADFGIDIEQDLIRAITAKSKDEKQWGKTVTGKDAFNVSVKINLSSIKDFLELCYERYLSEDYKENFGWIDQIAEIKDPKLKDELNSKLIENLKNNNLEKTWMAVPEIIEWEHINGFRYSHRKEDELKDDIDILGFLATMSDEEKQNLSLDLLKSKIIYCIGSQNDEIKYHWKAYGCLYCEAQNADKNKTCFLSNGKWYEIESNFVQEVNTDFQNLRNAGASVALPGYSHNNENEYNKAVAEGDGRFCCMDCNLINHGGAHNKVEFCDLLTKDKKLIHIKRYGGSSVLSHLFFQGLVSGELFRGDEKFREKVNAKLPDGFKITDTKAHPSGYEIIFGIISSFEKDLDIPFFSKVSLRNAKRRLETFGYPVSILKISKNSS